MKRRGWILAVIAIALAVLFFSHRPSTEVAAADPDDVDATTTTTTTVAQADPAPVEHPYETSEGDADCTVDCSGHEAGWKWAKEHDITNDDDCGGNSQSFIEGCQAYARHEDSDEGEPAEP